MKLKVKDGQFIFSHAAAAVYMAPYGQVALTKLSFSINYNT
jgi:hypothetical protein